MAWIRDPQTGAVVDDGENAWVDAPAAPTAEKSGVLRRAVGDPLTGLAKGVLVGIPQAAVGLGRLATLGMADPLLNPVSTTLDDMSKRVDKSFSPEHQQQAKEVAETKGFFPTMGALLSRPGYMADVIAEQLPTMAAGGKLGQAVAGAKGATIAGAAGEGLATAGQNVEQIHQAAGGESTVGQKLLGGLSGAVTGVISGAAGKLSQKLGITDIDTMLAGGARGTGKLLPSIGKGMLQEGVLEELPQSVSEQMFSNVALDRPLTEGVAEAGATGMVLGAAMGGGAQLLNRPNPQDELHNKRMREALAGVQVLAEPATGGVTKEHTQALRAVREYATNVAGGDPAALAEWELAQTEAINKGLPVSFDGVPGITNDASAKAWAANRAVEMQTRMVGTAAQPEVTDEFGNIQQQAAPEQLPRMFTKQQRAEFDQLQKAIAEGNTEEMARLQGKLYAPTPKNAAPAATAAAPAAEAPAAPAAPKVDAKKPSTWDDATLAEKAGKIEADDTTPTANAIRKEVGRRAEIGRTYTEVDAMPTKAARSYGIGTLTSPSAGKAYSNGTVTALEKQLAAKLPNGGTVSDLISTLGNIANELEGSAGLTAELAQQYGKYLVEKTQGGSNVQTTTVNQGTQSESGNAQSNAASVGAPPQAPAKGAAPAKPAQKAAKEEVAPKPPAPAKEVAKEEEVAPKPPAPAKEVEPTGEDWEAALAEAKKGTGKEALAKLKAERARINAAINAAPEDGRTSLLEARAKIADEITRTMDRMEQEELAAKQATAALQAKDPVDTDRLLSPQAHWEARRERDAKAAGVPIAEWHVPAWGTLSEKVRAVWSKSDRKEADYKAAKEVTRAERAAEVAHKVGVNAAVAFKSDKDWLDRVNAAYDMMQRIAKLAKDAPTTAAGKAAHAKAVQALIADFNKFSRTGHASTFVEVREAFGEDLVELFPAHSIEELRAMSKERLKEAATPAQKAIAKAMANYLKKNPDGLSPKQREVLKEKLVAMKEVGKQLFGINKSAWTLEDAAEVFAFINDTIGTTVGAYKVVLESISGTNRLAELLTNISQMSSTPGLRELAKAVLAKGVSGVTVVYKPELSKGTKADGTAGWRRGTYNAETNTITIYQGGENAQVILHEVVHAMTVRALNRAGAITAPKNQEEMQARKGYLQLVELFEALKAMPEFAGEYAFKNVHEFVAEVNSNPKLQEKLSNTLPPAGLFGKLGKSFGSAMDAFIEAIRNLLGLRPTSVDALTTALQVTAGYFEPNQGAVKSTGSFDSLSSPIAAVTAPFQKAQQYLISADKAMGKLNLTDLKAEAYKVWLGAVSSDYISAAAKRIPGLGKLQEFIGNWFETDRRKTQVKSLISKDVYDGFVRKFELALRDTGDYNRYNKLMGDMAGEASRLGFDITKNFEDNNVGRGGKTQQPKLEPHLREHVNKLHQQFKSLQQSPNKSLKALANLLVEGEKVNRKMFTMQIATNIRDILHHHAQSGKSPAAATVLLNKYAGALDILQDSKGLTNTNPGMQLDGLSAKLHDTLMEVFDNAETYFPKGDIQDDLKTIRKAYMQAWSAPYMHLGRHGMYVVKFNVKEANAQAVAALGKLLGDRGFTFGPFLKTAEGQSREVFLRVETLKEMQEIEALLRGTSGLVGQKDGKLDLQAGAISDVGVDNMFGVGKTMEALRTRMNARFEGVRASAAKNPAMKQAYEDVMAMMTQEFLDMLDVNSARQVNQQRKGITGYSSDYMQNFAKRAQWADASIANMYTMRDYSLAFKGMQDSIDGLKSTDSKAAVRGQAIHDELATRFSNSLKPNTNRAVNVLSVFGHNFYLALSPAYTIGNLLQPYMLTLPLLGGRHGFVKTAKAMGKATADIMGLVKHSVKEGWQEGGWRGILDAKLELSKSGITADELAFVQHLIRSGIVDATQSHELGRMAKGESSSVATAAKTLSMFNHYSEVTNRLTAGLTAYRLAKANPIKGVDPTEYAIDAVRRTQYDYADHNKARYIGRHGVFGAATPLFMQFQTFAFFTMEHYLRMFKDGFIEKMPPGHEREKAEARKALAGTLTATALVAGTMGLPFATVLAAAANAAGDDDRDARARYREWLVSIFGKDMAEIVAKGALSRGVAGIDLTGSLGQQDLLPGSRWMADRRNWEDKIKDQSKTMLGPAINAGFDIYGGIDKAKNGDVMAGIHQLMPRFLKGPIGALDVAEKGAFSNKSGTTLPIPVTSWDYLKMMGGWTPQKKAEQSEANFYFQSEQTQRKQDKARAKKEITTARDAGDYELAASLLLQHNLDHPTDRIAGLGGTMAAMARGQAYAALSGSGIIDANRKHLPTMQAYGAWANTGIGHE